MLTITKTKYKKLLMYSTVRLIKDTILSSSSFIISIFLAKTKTPGGFHKDL